jgi:nitroreductase
MADNYLEKRAEELRQKRTVVVKKGGVPLESLLKRNRSFRGYDRSVEVSEAQLLEMVKTVTWVASGMNAQPLRFRLVTGDEANNIHPLVKLGAALPEEHLPHPGEEPSAYIVICSTVEENKIVDMDLGIAAQSILLKATEMGLGGIFILNFKADAVQTALSLQMKPLAVLGIGKPAERIFLMPCHEGDSLAYYRKDGVHYVPKIKVEDLIVK